MSIMRIAQVLLRESDRDHPLTQQEILDFMETKYAMTVSRKSIGRNLSRLKEAGLPVVCREVTRVVNGKEAPLALDWYWDHVLSQDDLKVLIDLLYFSHLPAQQVRQLSEKLKRLQSRTFDDGKENIKNLPALGRPGESGEVLALLTRALSQKKQVSFYYDHYEADGKKHHGYTVSGEDKLYRVSPYHLVASDDRYFLLGNEEGSEGISVFKTDMMSQVTVTEEPARLQTSLESVAQGGKLLSSLFAYHGLYTGDPVSCTFEADWHLMSDIVDDFGKAAHLVSARQDLVTVEVTIPASAMKAWALKHAPLVKVTAPSYLVKEVKDALWSRQKVYQFLHITEHLFAYHLLLSTVCLKIFASQTGKIIVVPLFNHAEYTLTAITVDDDIMRYTH